VQKKVPKKVPKKEGWISGWILGWIFLTRNHKGNHPTKIHMFFTSFFTSFFTPFFTLFFTLFHPVFHTVFHHVFHLFFTLFFTLRSPCFPSGHLCSPLIPPDTLGTCGHCLPLDTLENWIPQTRHTGHISTRWTLSDALHTLDTSGHLSFRNVCSIHTFAKVNVTVRSVADAALAHLPSSLSPSHIGGGKGVWGRHRGKSMWERRMEWERTGSAEARGREGGRTKRVGKEEYAVVCVVVLVLLLLPLSLVLLLLVRCFLRLVFVVAVYFLCSGISKQH
jgi:hypothetical protein